MLGTVLSSVWCALNWHSISVRSVLLVFPPVYRKGKLGPAWLSNLPSITPALKSQAGKIPGFPAVIRKSLPSPSESLQQELGNVYMLTLNYFGGDFAIAPLACSLRVQLSVSCTSQGVWPRVPLKWSLQLCAHPGGLDLIWSQQKILTWGELWLDFLFLKKCNW